jgi:hypothetical protein
MSVANFSLRRNKLDVIIATSFSFFTTFLDGTISKYSRKLRFQNYLLDLPLKRIFLIQKGHASI